MSSARGCGAYIVVGAREERRVVVAAVPAKDVVIDVAHSHKHGIYSITHMTWSKCVTRNVPS